VDGAYSHLDSNYALVEVPDLVSIAAALRGEGEERLVDLVGGQASIGGGCRRQASIGDTALGRTRDASTATRRSSDGSRLRSAHQQLRTPGRAYGSSGTRIHMSR
jgi:hypothetical protein